MLEQHPSPTPNGHGLGTAKDEGIAIIVDPLEGENVSINHTPEGGITIYLRGEIAIAIAPSKSKAASDAVKSQEVHPDEASESPLSARNAQSNGLVPETGSSNASAPVRGSERASQTKASPTPDSETPENENRKFELKGNPVYDPYYKARKSGKLLADFTLATHDKQGATRYWRIRGFDEVAVRIRDTVRRGQKDVEAVVYGPKYWTQKKKTKEGGWTQETVKGYYAGMVRVPERYRNREAESDTQQTAQ